MQKGHRDGLAGKSNRTALPCHGAVSGELLQKARFPLKESPDWCGIRSAYTGPLHARVKDLLKAGVPVALGQDDIADAYYPYGECNMLQVAFLASHFHMVSFDDMELLYDMITTSAAKVLGIKNHELKEGGDADLVVLQDEDVYHAIWHHTAPAYVIKNGVDITVK